MNCVEYMEVSIEIPAVYFPKNVPLCSECFQSYVDDEEYWESRFKEDAENGK